MLSSKAYLFTTLTLSAILVSTLGVVWISYGENYVLGYELPWNGDWIGLGLDLQGVVPDTMLSRILLGYSAPLIGSTNAACVLYAYVRPRRKMGTLLTSVVLSLGGIVAMVLIGIAGPSHYTTCVCITHDVVAGVFVLYILAAAGLLRRIG